MFELRPYQQEAVDNTMRLIKKSTSSALIELATGAGKSIVIAELANQINALSGKKTLCLAPSKELITQNFSKYLAFGNPASFWSASVGSKSIRHNAVFGTPLSVLNGIEHFRDGFACVVLDEAHGLTPTIKTIIDKMKKANPLLRVIGLTATPFRTGTGYIYKVDENGKPVGEHRAKEAYFDVLTYKLQTQQILDMGYLTKPFFGVPGSSYDAAGLKTNKLHKFEAHEVAEVFEGKGRLTSGIVRDVVDQADHSFGVMFFASSIAHSEEIAESLPPDITRIVTGKTPKQEREQSIKDFQSGDVHYLINVSVLTTGFDAPNVGTVAILRPTESPGLLLQIIGRGLRLFEGKDKALILDYAGNMERHGLSNDNLNPEIEVAGKSSESSTVDVVCPDCAYTNEFTVKPDAKGYELDVNGFIVDAFGKHINNEQGHPVAGHMGQRCRNEFITKSGVERCTYRFAFKQCMDCDTKNSLSARLCVSCQGELINPNDKLAIRNHEKALKTLQALKAGWQTSNVNYHRACASKTAIRVLFVTDRQVPYFISPDSEHAWVRRKANNLLSAFGIVPEPEMDYIAAINSAATPAQIKYRKRESGFFDVEVLT